MIGSPKSREHAEAVARKLRSEAGAHTNRNRGHGKSPDSYIFDSRHTADEHTAQALVATNELLDLWARTFPRILLAAVLLSGSSAIFLIQLEHFKSAIVCVVIGLLLSVVGYAFNLNRYIVK